MYKYLFPFVIAFLLGGYLVRSFFPAVKTETVVRRVVEQTPPEIIERVVYDTTEVTKWKTRVLYKTLRPEQVIEVPKAEILELLPGHQLTWAILSAELSNSKMLVDVYGVQDSTLLSYQYDVENDWKLRLNQGSGTDPLILLEERDIFDLWPEAYLGYGTIHGPQVRLHQRLWRLHVNWVGEQDGLGLVGEVRLW